MFHYELACFGGIQNIWLALKSFVYHLGYRQLNFMRMAPGKNLSYGQVFVVLVVYKKFKMARRTQSINNLCLLDDCIT